MRLHALDYLRGLAAFSIMMFHYFSFSYGDYGTDTFLGKIGIYGVSIFYILSGLTLYWVYNKRFRQGQFFIKRFFRIYPLLWLATFLHVLFDKGADIQTLILNLTGLFGFVAPDNYIAVGAWSIGNELFFYALFPIFIWAKNRTLLIYLLAILFIIYLAFAFVLLDPSDTLVNQWSLYVQPLNQAFLFAIGFAIGHYSKGSFKWPVLLIALASLLFILYPSSEDAISIVTGFNRLFFTLLAAVLCYGFYKFDITLPEWLHSPLSMLGAASYSVYLMHPIMWRGAIIIVGRLGVNVPSWLLILLCSVLTIVISYTIYQWFEKPFVRLGNRIIHTTA